MCLEDDLEKMRAAVKAAESEIIMAFRFHETWKPAAYDQDLHKRMGHSYATHSFQIIRQALRREMLLALLRLWDTNPQAIRMTAISETLRKREFFDVLVANRAIRTNFLSMRLTDSIRAALESKRDSAVKIIRKYCEGGSGHKVMEKLRNLRHEHLAHRQTNPTDAPHADATDKEIEEFYQDNLKLIEILLSLVLETAFDLEEAAGMYRHYASLFWAGVRGERTEGHPNFKSPKLTK